MFTDDLVMPGLLDWFKSLSIRLRHVKIFNGDWSRVVTSATIGTLAFLKPDGVCGVFLDPPYSTSVRSDGLYQHDNDVTNDVREWAIKAGNNPKMRIVLAGFDTEHNMLERLGWRVYEWFDDVKFAFKGGMGNIGKNGNQQHRERLWASPYCLDYHKDK